MKYLSKEWRDKLKPIVEETKNIKTDQERREWIEKNPDKAAIIMAAFLVVTVKESIFV